MYLLPTEKELAFLRSQIDPSNAFFVLHEPRLMRLVNWVNPWAAFILTAKMQI